MGFQAGQLRSASAPSDASPTILKRELLPNDIAQPVTEKRMIIDDQHCHFLLHTSVDREIGTSTVKMVPSPGLESMMQVRAEDANPLGDSVEAITEVVRRIGWFRRVEPVPLSRMESETTDVPFFDHHCRFRGGGMFDDVCDGFLHDPINMNFRVLVKQAVNIFDPAGK